MILLALLLLLCCAPFVACQVLGARRRRRRGLGLDRLPVRSPGKGVRCTKDCIGCSASLRACACSLLRIFAGGFYGFLFAFSSRRRACDPFVRVLFCLLHTVSVHLAICCVTLRTRARPQVVLRWLEISRLSPDSATHLFVRSALLCLRHAADKAQA